jgi:molybdate transport system substrate-binding protein
VPRLKILWATLLLLAFAAPVAARELLVSAAASLTNAFKEIGAEFERSHSGDKVAFNFAASDVLLRQIVEGAPVDVFASADQEAMDRADKKRIIDSSTRRNFAASRLVLAVPRDSLVSLGSLEDLKAGAVRRIAISQPATVPVGRYAKAALDKSKLWDHLAGKFIYTQNVRQSLDYLARGEVDAGFVYSTDATIMGDKVRIAFEVATPQPVSYPIAVTAGAKNSKLAREFVDLVCSPTGQAVLQRFGFARP